MTDESNETRNAETGDESNEEMHDEASDTRRDESRSESDETASDDQVATMSEPADADVESDQTTRRQLEDGRESVIDVDGVTHTYGDVTVLEDVSFTVPSGSVTALVGPNGSGKTTLLRIVGGLMRSTAGRVDIGVDVPRPIGYLPQDPDFRPVFTVRETLAFYADLIPHEVDVDAAIEEVGLTAASDRRVDALSGGMRRLLGIAQATLGDPPLVLLDEPTGDLDPRMTEYIFEVVEDLSGEGTAILLATHNLSGAERADDLLLIDRGSMVATGPPADVVAEAGADSLKEAFLTLVGAEGGLTVRTGREESP